MERSRRVHRKVGPTGFYREEYAPLNAWRMASTSASQQIKYSASLFTEFLARGGGCDLNIPLTTFFVVICAHTRVPSVSTYTCDSLSSFHRRMTAPGCRPAYLGSSYHMFGPLICDNVCAKTFSNFSHIPSQSPGR